MNLFRVGVKGYVAPCLLSLLLSGGVVRADAPNAANTNPATQNQEKPFWASDDVKSEKLIRYGLTGGIAVSFIPDLLGGVRQNKVVPMPYLVWLPGYTVSGGATREYCIVRRSSSKEVAQAKADEYAADVIRRMATARRNAWMARQQLDNAEQKNPSTDQASLSDETINWNEAAWGDPSLWSSDDAFKYQKDGALGTTPKGESFIYWQRGLAGACSPLMPFGIFAGFPLKYSANINFNGTPEEDVFFSEVLNPVALGVAWSPTSYLMVMAGYSGGTASKKVGDVTKSQWVGAPIVAVGTNIDLLGLLFPR